MGRVRCRGRDRVRSIFLDNNVDPGSIKDVDPGTCCTWQNHGDHLYHMTNHVQTCSFPDEDKPSLIYTYTH